MVYKYVFSSKQLHFENIFEMQLFTGKYIFINHAPRSCLSLPPNPVKKKSQQGHIDMHHELIPQVIVV